MFDFEQPPAEEKESTDYTGLIIVAFLAPVLLLFICLGKTDVGFTVCIILGMISLVIKVRWNLRKHAWFWATIALVLALQVPLLYLVRWPHGKTPTIAYSMPFAIAEFLFLLGATELAKKLFSKGSSSDGEED